MQFKFIKHKNLSDFELKRIIELKDKIWVHGFGKQDEWIKQNVSENDIHVLLENENNLIAYAQLVQIGNHLYICRDEPNCLPGGFKSNNEKH